MTDAKSRRSGGRPSSFKTEYIELAKHFALLGATDKQMADAFGVAESTFHKWKIDYPELSESLKEGKLQADAMVSKSLYHRALGYSHEAVKIMTVAGAVEKVKYIEHYPPDTTACIFWLKNRQPEIWRDKPESELGDGLTDVIGKLIDKLPS